MSLFGDDADTPSTRPKSSLFDDDTAQAKPTSSSMFGDNPADANDSPWGFTPKKTTGRGSLVKHLLADADVPDLYIDTFDSLQTGGSVKAREAQQLLRDSGVSRGDQDTIWRVASSNGESAALGRGECNVLLALIGLAQEGEELSLDAVDERRRKLPTPSLPTPKREEPAAPQQQAPATPQKQAQSGATQQATTPLQQQQNGHSRKQSFGAGFGESDPWASPDMHKGHKHLNGVGSAKAPQRTTSAFTTGAAEPSDSSPSGTFGNGSAAQASERTSWGGTSGYGAGSADSGFDTAGAAGEGFGGGDEGSSGSGAGHPIQRPSAAPRVLTSKGAEEVVTVNLLDEKEGMFLFQHRNYEVASLRRASKVIRRYSDFIWLLDCLHKRYPFRQLPLLPPKRVAINGNHIAADQTFVEKRRRGLARFANALVRHPVLREEQLVVMFLTVPTVDACPPSPPSPKSNGVGDGGVWLILLFWRDYRNSQSGGNKRPSACKRSSSARACLLRSRTAYPGICRRHSIRCAQASAGQRTCTSTSAT